MVKSVQELESKQAALKLRLGAVLTDKARESVVTELTRVDALLAALRK